MSKRIIPTCTADMQRLDFTQCRHCAAFLHEDESGYGYCARFGRSTHYSRLCDGEQGERRGTAAHPATANTERKPIFKT